MWVGTTSPSAAGVDANRSSAIDHVAQRLSRQLVHLNTQLVARVLWDTNRHHDEHPNRDVVPILVQDAARDRLRVLPPLARQSGSYRGH